MKTTSTPCKASAKTDTCPSTACNSSQWYVLYTAPRAEKRAAERLSALGYDCWLPLIKTVRAWSDRTKTVEVPLFNSYLFIRCKVSELREILNTYGIVRVVFYDKSPAIVRDHEIEEIKKLIVLADTCSIESGDTVEIICGSLKMVSGKVLKIKKNYLVLYLEQLGATVCIKPCLVKKTTGK